MRLSESRRRRAPARGGTCNFLQLIEMVYRAVIITEEQEFLWQSTQRAAACTTSDSCAVRRGLRTVTPIHLFDAVEKPELRIVAEVSDGLKAVCSAKEVK